MVAYPTIYLACHREHVHADEQGNRITEHQASVLDHLDIVRPTTPSRLAEHMGVSRSTMSSTVSRLVHTGLLVRKRARNDGRHADGRRPHAVHMMGDGAMKSGSSKCTLS